MRRITRVYVYIRALNVFDSHPHFYFRLSRDSATRGFITPCCEKFNEYTQSS